MTHLFSVVPVSDREAAAAWYAVLFGRPADDDSDGEATWEVTDTAWIVVVEDRERAGYTQLTIAVSALDEMLARVDAQGIEREDVETYGNGVRHVVVVDPDGNRIAFAAARDDDR